MQISDDTVSRQRIALVGAGAIGLWLGAHLARTGAPISALARGATLAALKQHGLRLTLADHSVLQAPVQASERAEALGPQDLVVIAVKAPALPDVAAQIGSLIGPHTVILSAMNGVPWWFFEGFGGAQAGRSLQSIDPKGEIGARIGTPITLDPEDRHKVTRKLGRFKTSMLQDVEAGKAIELDALLTVVHELGQRTGVATPLIDALLGMARLQARVKGLYPWPQATP